MAKIIGLTGGIGAGKTEVSDYLSGLGYPIIDADVIAREVVEPGTIGLAQLTAYFGKEILLPDGALDRRHLGQLIFQNEEERKVLNAITHPIIDRVVRQQLQEHENAEQIFLVVPLLFESGLEETCDEIWLVTVDKEVQIQRIMDRDAVDRDMATQKIASQLDQEERLTRKPLVLRNNSDLPALYRQVDDLLHRG